MKSIDPSAPFAAPSPTVAATLRTAIRGHVCTICYQRPPHSETFPANIVRSCEAHCAIFLNLANLVRIDAQDAAIDTPGECEHVMREEICRKCTLCETAGDYCADRLNRTCPLSRYMPTVLQLIEEVAPGYRFRPAA